MAADDGGVGKVSVGVIVGDLHNPFYSELVEGLVSILSAHDLEPVVAESHDDPDLQQSLTGKLTAEGVGGLIASITRDAGFLVGLEVPVVGIGPANHRLPYVSVDNVLGGEVATEHLVVQGYRRIGILLDDLDLTPVADRYEGYLRALADGNLEANPALAIVCPGGSARLAADAASRLVDLGADSVFAINDVMGLGAIGAIRARKLRVGADIGVVGYDETPLAKDNDMTSITATTYTLGREAAKMLVTLLRNPGTQFSPVLMAPRLVARGSSSGHRSA